MSDQGRNLKTSVLKRYTEDMLAEHGFDSGFEWVAAKDRDEGWAAQAWNHDVHRRVTVRIHPTYNERQVRDAVKNAVTHGLSVVQGGALDESDEPIEGDIEGIFELERVSVENSMLKFRGINENVRVPMEGLTGEDPWEGWQDTIGHEYRILAARGVTDKLTLEEARLVPNSDERIALAQGEECAREKVIKLALLCAGDQFDVAAEDPGWESEMHDDYLRDAVIEFANAIRARRAGDPQ